MDNKELNELINDSNRLHSFAERYFLPFSQDGKTIETNKKQEIIGNICDEYGYDYPTSKEIEQYQAKLFGNANIDISSVINEMSVLRPQIKIVAKSYLTLDEFTADLKLYLQVIEYKM